MVDSYGIMVIYLNDSIILDGINVADINSTNTDIKLIPYIDQIFNYKINQSLFDFSWKAIKLTKNKLRI